MYSLSNNKNFLTMFFKKEQVRYKIVNKMKYSVSDITLYHIIDVINQKPKNKYYISKILITKHASWLFVYLFVYSITNLRIKMFRRKTKIYYHNYSMLYQTYVYARYKYVT
jgi:hypothetical protein